VDVNKYFQSLSSELHAVKNRVRNFIGSNHWPTDGEWKETVLRTVLRRHLPNNVKIGRGFVVRPNSPSKQIDVLIYDSSKPILYQDGDLIMLSCDAVKGIIEVKSNIEIAGFRQIIDKLANNAQFIYEGRIDETSIFVGLFAYDSNIGKNHSQRVLNELRSVANQKRQRVVNHVALGNSLFIRYWATSPTRMANYCQWHFYWLHRMSCGYFVNNVVDSVAEESVSVNEDIWFPAEGKEGGKVDQMHL
jgi:hypothetical protein